jgi:GH15 family glucan-1,4-alpha-glucosidase
MSKPIADYGFIGNMLSAALVARDGSMDWLCLPRFDSEAMFAALIGTDDNGRWRIAPEGTVRKTHRNYRDGTTILETHFESDSGAVTLVDFMPITDDEEHVHVVRLVVGEKGRVAMNMELTLRFGYGQLVPWVRRTDYGLSAVSGPDAVEIHTPVELEGKNLRTYASFEVAAGETVPFVLAWHPSHKTAHTKVDAEAWLKKTESFWRDWVAKGNFPPEGHPYHEPTVRSVVMLKALTFRPTGGIVAAPTTSLPERIGGSRNWDYRYCWIRDATLTLYALLECGYRAEAEFWRRWLLRASSGLPQQLQIMYGLAGERRLTELELTWLPGYEGSKPVRIGNAAFSQLQIDVYGELMDALHTGRACKLERYAEGWDLQKVLLGDLKTKWRQPDSGIWEMRGPPQHFTYSRLMAWVAFDRGIKAIEESGYSGPLEEWRAEREAIRNDILANGWNEKRRAFVQFYDGDALDAALLQIPLVGFLPPDDPRVISTVDAIARELVEDGLVHRYHTHETPDGLPHGEGTFLVCSFWLADALTMIGRYDDGKALFERLLALRNDLGLLSEEYDPRDRRLLGNFPQAFSHVGIVNTAKNLLVAKGPSEQRSGRAPSQHAPPE